MSILLFLITKSSVIGIVQIRSGSSVTNGASMMISSMVLSLLLPEPPKIGWFTTDLKAPEVQVLTYSGHYETTEDTELMSMLL